MNQERSTFSGLGKYGIMAEKVAEEVNIPYLYLPGDVRTEIRGMIKTVIAPKLQELHQQGKEALLMSDVISLEKSRLSPDKMRVNEFIMELESAYRRKIESHNLAADLISGLKDGRINKFEFLQEARGLLKTFPEIEATFFAAGNMEKKYVQKCVDDSGIADPELLRLYLTPAIPNFPILYELDLREFLISNGEKRQISKASLIKKYFNGDPIYAESFLNKYLLKMEGTVDTPQKRIEIKNEIDELREYFHERQGEKIYLLIERKLRYMNEVNLLITYDDYFDQVMTIKCCFLHDLFLKIFANDILSANDPFSINQSNLKEKVVEVLSIPDQDLINRIDDYLRIKEK